MRPSVSFSDFKKADGQIDWAAYHAAEVVNGEKCHRCGGWEGLIFPKGYRSLCRKCDQADREPGSVTHSSRVRCPKCRHQWDIWDGDHYRLLEEGTHDIQCGECEHEFEVETSVSVSYSFESPEVVAEESESEPEPDEAEDEE